MLSFFPRGVLDEILNLIESVSEDFPSYSYMKEFSYLKEKNFFFASDYVLACYMPNVACIIHYHFC